MSLLGSLFPQRFPFQFGPADGTLLDVSCRITPVTRRAVIGPDEFVPYTQCSERLIADTNSLRHILNRVIIAHDDRQITFIP